MVYLKQVQNSVCVNINKNSNNQSASLNSILKLKYDAYRCNSMVDFLSQVFSEIGQVIWIGKDAGGV